MALFCALGVSHESVASPQKLVDIRFVGNETTEPRVMLEQMTVKIGQPVTMKEVERSRQAIMDLGLFKKVDARLEDVPEGKVLIITVEEKYYVLPLPRVDGKPDGEYDYGAEVRFDNLAGLNQKLKLLYLVHDSLSKENPRRQEMSIEYGYPRFGGTSYDVSLLLRVNREVFQTVSGDIVTARYQRDRRELGVDVSRWLQRNGPSAGWRGGLGLELEQWDWTRLRGTPDLYDDSQAVAGVVTAGFRDVHDYRFYRDGKDYGYRGRLALPQAGSDYSFYTSQFYLRSYNPLGNYRNLNWQLQLGIANGNRFDGPAFSVGGRGLHGYDSEYGNAYILSNLEYLHPISGYKQLRAVALLDLGNVYPGAGSIEPGDLKAGVGFGFRWKVQSFVNINLAFDWGYGVQSHNQATYFTTSGTF